MDNMKIYNALGKTPAEAIKPIAAGRLKGFSDINPMWRIKALTETFGMCGIGWKYEITDKRIIEGANGEQKAFVDIDLYVKENGEWSEAIPGIGGSSFVSKETGGLYTTDECFKCALSDAIGTASKALGMSADVYFSKDRTKYNTEPAEPTAQTPTTQTPLKKTSDLPQYTMEKCEDCGKEVSGKVASYSKSKFMKCLCMDCQKK